MDTLGTWMMPPQSSTVAAEVDGLYYFLFYMSLFFMVLIYGATAWFAWKYRRRGKRDVKTTGPDQNHRLEVTWTVLPTILVLIIFVWGFKGYLRMTIVPGDAYEVNVIAQKWSWQFRYPDGTITGELGVPVDRPVKLIMTSQDVLHSFYVPQFRIKMDVIPNRYTLTWFEAVRTGTFDIFCTEYCGKGHSEMLNKVVAMPANEFEDWLAEQGGAGLP
ncbi:MAG TPA: cytochrome c oxidase subunit II, partial [candidate division Zixibacteria bacterium]|nr:cytochrome c oxidase subunit II [candidate division Zixibacteria bacterium]